MSSALTYPDGVSLYQVGFAALRYPELAPGFPIPLSNLIGGLQRTPIPIQQRSIAQLGSQYLQTLLEYQYSDAPALHDPSSDQYYFSSAMQLLNYLSGNPDIAEQMYKHPNLLRDTIEKVLLPDIEEKITEASLGSALQTISTLLLQDTDCTAKQDYPRLKDLEARLKLWKRKYRGKYIAKVSERLLDDQLKQPNRLMNQMMIKVIREQLRCGYTACNNNCDMSLCGGCRVQRYCCQEHQKKDWKWHKMICKKGLVEPDMPENSEGNMAG